ncbi:MAG: hypothetical protein C5B53_11295 [Candidatus Melainabacteria bacterium]|nr:MAG: hypothetical protein C5B53_11295 [Candidatus Melainabacteria bacterium]
MRTHRIVLCSLVLIFAAGCTNHQQIRQSSKDEPTPPAQETTTEPTEITLQGKCPNLDDGRVSVAECQQLIDSAQSVVDSILYFDDTVADDQLVSDWKAKEHLWKAKNDKLISSCELLLGADGTPVFPEIPRALLNLSRADEALVKSIDAAALSHRKKAKSYMRGARAHVNRAMKLLDGV